MKQSIPIHSTPRLRCYCARHECLCAILFILVLTNIADIRADIVYNVSFDDSGFVPGEACPTGDPPHYPQNRPYSGNSGIEYSSDFGSQVADLGWLEFDPASLYTSGTHILSWQAWVDASDPTTGWPGVVVTLAGTSVQIADSSVSVAGTQVGFGPFSYQSIFDCTVVLDLDQHSVSFYVDSIPYIVDQSLPDGIWLSGVTMQHPANNNALVDNFRWEIIPEPSSVLLVLCGAVTLINLRLRK